MFSFACQKRTRKAPATFEAREARIKGCSPLIIPKQKGSIQKIQVAALKDFLCSADWKPLSRCATAPPSGSKRTRKHCGLHGNFPAMPKPPSVREVASRSDDGRSPYPDHSFSRTSCDSSLKEGASGETGRVAVCQEAFPPCHGLSLWESWQARQGLTERASQLPAAHSKSLIRLPKPCGFLIFPPLKVKNPAEKRFRWFKNRFGCAILGVKVPVWTGNRRA